MKTSTQAISQEQIDRCHRIVNEKTGEVFYQVESETTSDTYEVHYIQGRGFTCTCKAGQNNFHNCSKGTCKHCRWSVAHAQEFKANAKREARIATLETLGLTHAEASKAVSSNALINGKPATDEELVRIFSGVQRPTEAEMNAHYARYQSRAFSLTR